MTKLYSRKDTLDEVLQDLKARGIDNPVIMIMGDYHGYWYGAIENYFSICQERGRKPDLLIQVGDFGYYPGQTTQGRPAEPYLDHQFGHPLIFIDGNHEDHEKLRPLAGTRVGADCYYVPRGYLWEGILFAGGAYSVDKAMRLATGAHWSPMEELSVFDAECIIQKHKTEKVHTIISHTAPSSFDLSWAASPMFGGENKKEMTRQALNLLLQHFRPSNWFFGHWHKSGTRKEGKTNWRVIDMVRSERHWDYHWTTLNTLKGLPDVI